MSSTFDNSKDQKTRNEYWGETPKLTSEQIILWLEGHRSWMFEVWKNDPSARKKWEAINLLPKRK